MAAPRDYKSEYKAYQGTPEQIHNRAQRNKARAIMVKAGEARKGDGKDVGHIKAMSKGGTTTPGNIEMQSRSGNRSFSRNPDGSMKSEKSRSGR
jgi:hypothetical protein